MSAEARLRRLLALVPWVASRDGPSIEEVCVRFGCTEEELLGDLDLLFVCGLYPYTPDMLIDVDIADGRVWIKYADYFARPLRLTPAEGVALVAAGRTVLAAPGADPNGPLARGLAKLAAAVGVGESGAIDVELGLASESLLDTLRQATGARSRIEIEYYSFGRDEWTRRQVDPYAVFAAEGQWYLAGWCHRVDDERLFRVDRIRDVAVLPATFEAPAEPPELTVFHPRPADARITLELDSEAGWVSEQYPVDEVEELGDGRVRVRLVASGTAWLERLLLRVGPHARILDGDVDLGRRAACRVLERYTSR